MFVTGQPSAGAAGLFFMWYDSFTCVTWQLYMWHYSITCDMTSLYVSVLLYMRYRTTICWRYRASLYVILLLYVCDMTALHVTRILCKWNDCFICDTTPLYALQDNHLLALHDFSLCDLTPLRVWHDSFTCDITPLHVTWLLYMYHYSCMFVTGQPSAGATGLLFMWYGVAMMSRLLKIIGLLCLKILGLFGRTTICWRYRPSSGVVKSLRTKGRCVCVSQKRPAVRDSPICVGLFCKRDLLLLVKEPSTTKSWYCWEPQWRLRACRQVCV